MSLFGKSFFEDLQKASDIVNEASKPKPDKKKETPKPEPKAEEVKTEETKSEPKEEPKEPKKVVKNVTTKTAPKDAPKGDSKLIKNSALEAITESYKYAKTDTLNKDVQAAIQGEPITDALRKTLEVLVDNERFCQFLLSQCEVAKSRERDRQYTLGHKYVDVDGDGIPDVAIEALGNRDLGLYNIEIKVIRKDKNGKEIGEATESEAKRYLDELEEKKRKAKAKDTPKGDDGDEPESDDSKADEAK